MSSGAALAITGMLLNEGQEKGWAQSYIFRSFVKTSVQAWNNAESATNDLLTHWKGNPTNAAHEDQSPCHG